ncbi:hypothetical protein HNR46_000801 [Haloferula luteola]|uniref:Ig-like domain-containing protein n=1 Tax=Haloferula luteola TaxID=595692 RepID=A0A840UZY4_9BACT|nr:LamG-like jellyroll fold domain-containing protein [Haloferula luteola]MBB5350573.1 hypothetical protein [Haloferula luteola]
MKPTLLLAGGLSTLACGDITYTLQFDPNSSAEAQQVANSVAVASAFYNQYGSFNKHWSVYSNSGIPTAEANYDGYMGFGGIRNERVVFHEAGHTFGMGTHGNYYGLIAGGVWRGYWGNQAQFNTYLANGDGGYADGLHGDNHAIWPGGFNYDAEDGFLRRIWQTRIMSGIRADMGILSITQEARNEFAAVGGTVEFRITSPRASSFQWFRNGVPLTNDTRIAGAQSSLLRLSSVSLDDAGVYFCAATGAGETLNSRTRQLWVRPQGLDAYYALDGNTQDSAQAFHATASGSPTYTAGHLGQAMNLDGSDDFIELPATAVASRDFTLATWVRWDGGGNWQRIFDFGNDTLQYLALTPKSGSNDMRLIFKDAINGLNQEYVVTTTVLPTGQWTHVAAVKKGSTLSLYINGKPVASRNDVNGSLVDFAPTHNYLGKSQYADPLFDGRIDDFRIYNQALDGSEIWTLGTSGSNSAPALSPQEMTLPAATFQASYLSNAVTEAAANSEDSNLTFTKISGPAWATVNGRGRISGTPNSAPGYADPLVIRVANSSGATSDALVHIPVVGTVGYWNFEEGSADASVPYAPANANQFDGSLTDLSGNGNGFSTWNRDWHAYRSQVPGNVTPQTGESNELSLQNLNDFPAISAMGTSLTSWAPETWTIEAAIRPNDATQGYQTFIGRDSQGASGTDYGLASFYFAINPEGALRVVFADRARNAWALNSSPGLVQDGQWHAVAATSDGKTLSIFLKNLTAGDAEYTRVGQLDISASTDPALTAGVGDGGDWDAGVFTLARGLFNGGHTDRFLGFIDDVRFTEGVLETSAFLYSAPPQSPAELWRQTAFGISTNTGDAADEADPDLDGIPNLLERALGGDPHHADLEILPFIDLAPSAISLVFQKSLAATDVTITVLESEDLAGDWVPATGTETVLSDDGEVHSIRFTPSSQDSPRRFLRLEVSAL